MNRRAAAATAITIQTQKQIVNHCGAPLLTVRVESCWMWLFPGSEFSALSITETASLLHRNGMHPSLIRHSSLGPPQYEPSSKVARLQRSIISMRSLKMHIFTDAFLMRPAKRWPESPVQNCADWPLGSFLEILHLRTYGEA
jgi:hypothetical protein